MCEHRLGTLLLCGWCGAPFAICSRCYWGQRYCCDGCRDVARRKQCREADERYMEATSAKQLRSKRSRRSREKAKSLRQIDTDHPETQGSSAVIASPDGHSVTQGRPVGVEEAPDDEASMDDFARFTAFAIPEAANDNARAASLEHCRVCGRSIRWWIEAERLRAKARELRARARRGRVPRLPTGPAP